MKKLVKNLIENSIEAYIHALETINRPSVKYRMEAFCFLFCNAWELLMKAKLLKEGKNVFYKKKRKQPKRSWSLNYCLNRIFTSANDPVKLNIKKVYDFRCDAIHMVIPFVPSDIMGLFQAGVINYPKALRDWFGINLSDKIPLGMMVLIYDFDPQKHSLEYAKITRKLPAETVNWLLEFQSDIRKRAVSLGQLAQKYFIPIDLKLAIVKNPQKADIVLSSGTSGKKALIVEVPKDTNITHPYRRTEVVQIVNEKLKGTPSFNTFDFDCIVRAYNIKSRNEFCYLPKFSSPQYSQIYVDWIVKQATKKPEFFVRARKRVK